MITLDKKVHKQDASDLTLFCVDCPEDRPFSVWEKYNFVCAGNLRPSNEKNFSEGFSKIQKGNTVIVNQIGLGVKAIGVVISEMPLPLSDHKDYRKIVSEDSRFGHDEGDPSRCEYFLELEWKKIVETPVLSNRFLGENHRFRHTCSQVNDEYKNELCDYFRVEPSQLKAESR